MRAMSPPHKQWSSGLAIDHPIAEKSHLQPWSLPQSKDRSRNEELKDLFAAHLGGKSSGWGNLTLVKSLHRPIVHEGECRWRRIRAGPGPEAHLKQREKKNQGNILGLLKKIA